MPVQLPYLITLKNIPTLFDRIASAKVPDKFTHQFLQTTIGLKSTGDRALIPLLRALGFIDQSGTPSAQYNLLKAGDKRAGAIASGIKTAYAPLFDADNKANEHTGEKLKGLIAQVAGTDDELTRRIAGTFSTLVRLGDFTVPATKAVAPVAISKEQEKGTAPDSAAEGERRQQPPGLRTDFHYDIHVHLPSNGTEETYLNIFNALRKTFQ